MIACTTTERIEVKVNSLAESNVFVQKHSDPAVKGGIAKERNISPPEFCLVFSF